ncbi:transposase [Streptosporangium sp. CA-135522]|uniref:transposase n=1 Tax=Streptosporangium sp. CA-135522 TaxID=3240072 RepID=UPI003D8F97E6
MAEQRPYPSDLSDARWALVEPVLSAWRADRRGKGLDIGRPCEHDLRAILNAIVYVDRTGIGRRYLPHEYPPRQSIYALLRPLAERRRLHPAQRSAAASGPHRRRPAGGPATPTGWRDRSPARPSSRSTR